jgi:hypothetical protein
MCNSGSGAAGAGEAGKGSSDAQCINIIYESRRLVTSIYACHQPLFKWEFLLFICVYSEPKNEILLLLICSEYLENNATDS